VSSHCLFWAIKQPVGDPYQKLVLIVLADVANEKHQCWPSHDYIAALAECSRRTVVRAVEELAGKGLITVRQRTNSAGFKTSNLYHFHRVAPHNSACDSQSQRCDTEAQRCDSQSLTDVTDSHIILLEDTPNMGAGSDSQSQPPQKKTKRLTPPTLDDVRSYVKEKGYTFDPDYFHAHYESQDWRKGNGQKLSSWKAACVTFQKNENKYNPGRAKSTEVEL